MLKQVEKQRIADEIVDQIKSLILAGHYPPGSRLPAERDLSKTLGVNRSSLREALKKLEHIGLLSIRQGDGTRVTNFMETAGLELLEHLVPLAQSGYPRIIRDAIEFRLFYCLAVVEMAAERRSDEHLVSLREIAEKCDAIQTGSLLDVVNPAFEFWVTLVAATHNSVFGLLANSSRNALRTRGPLFSNFLISHEAVCRHHWEVIEAVTDKDATKAVAVTRDYIERSNQHVMDLLEAHKIELPAH